MGSHGLHYYTQKEEGGGELRSHVSPGIAKKKKKEKKIKEKKEK